MNKEFEARLDALKNRCDSVKLDGDYEDFLNASIKIRQKRDNLDAQRKELERQARQKKKDGNKAEEDRLWDAALRISMAARDADAELKLLKSQAKQRGIKL